MLPTTTPILTPRSTSPDLEPSNSVPRPQVAPLLQGQNLAEDPRTPPHTPRFTSADLGQPSGHLQSIHHRFDNPQTGPAMDRVIGLMGRYRSTGIALGGSAAITLRQLASGTHNASSVRLPKDLDIYINHLCRHEVGTMLNKAGLTCDSPWGITETRLEYHSDSLSADVFVANPTDRMNSDFKIDDFNDQIERGPWCNVIGLEAMQTLLERKKGAPCADDADIQKAQSDINAVNTLKAQIENGATEPFPKAVSAYAGLAPLV